jgi:hypothetical protein
MTLRGELTHIALQFVKVCGLFIQWIGWHASNVHMRVRLLHGLPSFYWSVAQLVQHLAVTQAARKRITGSSPVAPAILIVSAVSDGLLQLEQPRGGRKAHSSYDANAG